MTSPKFLSSNAQDFIEENITYGNVTYDSVFLSSNAQDFIEESTMRTSYRHCVIPEQ